MPPLKASEVQQMFEHYKSASNIWGDFNPVFPTINTVLDFTTNDGLGIGSFVTICKTEMHELSNKNITSTQEIFQKLQTEITAYKTDLD